MTSDPVIDVKNLGVVYGGFHAVKDLSLRVGRGELYALLGTNGAGKTSALEVVEGHRAATTGTVRVFGESPENRSTVRARTGIMLQESGFSPDLTVAETVRLLGRLSGRTDSVDRVLGLVDLRHKADTRVTQLSGGEKRRLDFATAVYGRPDLVFLDEPTTGMDIASRDALWETVQDLRDEGTTVVLTTHYLEEAQQRADRIGLMHRGTLRREGTVDELTLALPASIRFSVPLGSPAPPERSLPQDDRTWLIETFTLQRDLKQLLDWAEDHLVELQGLSAAPTRLDDVFRAVGTDDGPGPSPRH